MPLLKQGSWDVSIIRQPNGVWVQIFNFFPVEDRSAFRRLKVALVCLELTERFCLANKYEGWLAKIENPTLVAHLQALGGRVYQVDDDGLWVYKQVEKATSYPIREHVKRVEEVKCLKS